MFWSIFEVIILTQVFANAEICNNNLLQQDGDVYIFSDEAVIYQVAEERCQSYGGSIHIIDQNRRNNVIASLYEKYLTDYLSTVKVFTNVIDNGPNRIRSYIYREIGSGTSNFSFSPPEAGQLKSLKLFKRPFSSQGFQTMVRICYFFERDSLRSNCTDGWQDHILLYGGDSTTNRTIRLYNYPIKNGVSSRLSLTQRNNYVLDTGIPFIYLPDISLFIGARSEVGEYHWFWNNGTMITDQSFPTSNSSLCQEMTWPLTYDDGINLRPRNCDLGVAHYICKAEVTTFLQEVECDANSLKLVLQEFFFSNSTININIDPKSNAMFQRSNNSIINLMQRTNYTFQVEISFPDCNRTVTTTASGRTGYGIPDPVLFGIATSTENRCVVSWLYDIPLSEKILFKVVVISSRTITIVDGINEENSGKSRYERDIQLSSDDHGYNNTVSFQIFAVSSCGKESSPYHVSGICMTQYQPKPSNSPTIPIIIGVIAALIVLACVILVIICCKRKQRALADLKESKAINEMQQTIHQYEEIKDAKNANRTESHEHVGGENENPLQNHTYEVLDQYSYANT